MQNPLKSLNTAYLLVLPLLVAAFDLSFLAALLLLAAGLAWRWLLVITGLRPATGSEPMILETIPVSHYAEKVRWCLDKLGADYVERPCAGTLGAFTRGRTVPLLIVRNGVTESRIGNSPQILRFLWGTNVGSDEAEFLRPDKPRLGLEERLDRYGRHLQVWLYAHLLDHPELTRRLWSVDNPAVSAWQRATIRYGYPLFAWLVRRAFSVDSATSQRASQAIAELLEDMDTALADGRTSILGGERNFTDYTFAALSGAWLKPAGYAAGKADHELFGTDVMPAAMRADVERWREDYSRAAGFVESLYRNERRPRK